MTRTHGSTPPSFLFLQGLASPFFRILANKLVAGGAFVHRVNFCAGDVWFARGIDKKVNQTNFRGNHSALKETYHTLIKEHHVTTMILFGDCRPIHKIARDAAAEKGIEIIVFEEGYIRPGWITCEFGGTNDGSPLPRRAADIRKRAVTLTDLTQTELTQKKSVQPSLPNAMPPRVKMDLQFHAANLNNFWWFPNYVTHRPEKVYAELKGWLARFWRKRRYRTENEALIKLYETTKARFFFIPLQLTSDFQIREHSPYDGVPDFLGEVIASFAKKAKKTDTLLIKSHPLDNGMIDYRALIATCTAIHGITDRVCYVEGGDLAGFLTASKGVVLVNSTVGFAALKSQKPLKVMGRAVYDMAGLTHQGSLDSFWQRADKPDTKLVTDFLKVVRADSQIYGDFFTNLGMELATTVAANRLLTGPEGVESEQLL